MIEDKVMELIRQVEPRDGHRLTLRPATNEEINAFELAHELTLPSEVGSWLRRCNGANVKPGGLYGLFSAEEADCSMDWYLREYPEWKQKGWFPIASDGCGDLYILTTSVIIASTSTHPVFFLDQADDDPTYIVASGLWRFLFFLLEHEVLTQLGKPLYWPFDRKRVIAHDPGILECTKIPMPWKGNDE